MGAIVVGAGGLATATAGAGAGPRASKLREVAGVVALPHGSHWRRRRREYRRNGLRGWNHWSRGRGFHFLGVFAGHANSGAQGVSSLFERNWFSKHQAGAKSESAGTPALPSTMAIAIDALFRFRGARTIEDLGSILDVVAVNNSVTQSGCCQSF